MTKVGRRTGGESPRVKVVATPAMVALRKAQTRLNHFLWTTEICYGDVLSRSHESVDKDAPVKLTFGHVRSAAWFPNNQGREKFRESTGQFLEQTKRNTTELYRHVLVGYYSHCEDYLDQNVVNLRVGKKWGPLVRSLSSSTLKSANTPVTLHAVLCADFCRLVRNLLVHEPFDPLPVSVDDQRVKDWGVQLLTQAREHQWLATGQDVQIATEQVFGQVANHLKQAGEEGKDLAPEMFYMLFTFTNLDQLACQIEEALLPPSERLSTWISRSAEKVRREDLVIRED